MRLIRFLSLSTAALTLALLAPATLIFDVNPAFLLPLTLVGLGLGGLAARSSPSKKQRQLIAGAWLCYAAAALVTLTFLFSIEAPMASLAAVAALLLLATGASLRAVYLATKSRSYSMMSYYDY